MTFWSMQATVCELGLSDDSFTTVLRFRATTGFAMLETIRKYWVGLLVIVLVGIHASIVGVIRHQASLAKVDASCEVNLGQYLAYQHGKTTPMQMQLHAIVPLNHRMKSRQLIELNQAQIRQALEEYLRQLDSKFLIDPYLADLKSQLMEVMIQTIGDSSIDDLVITEVRQANDSANLEFISQGKDHQPRRLVATLRGQDESSQEAEHHHADGEHAPDEHAPDEHAETDHSNKEHAKPAAAPKASHGAPKKTEAKAGGHGAEKKPAKKSGH
ncbi:MAG: hypothetical protein ABL921_21645 [Pirellula sp.]